MILPYGYCLQVYSIFIEAVLIALEVTMAQGIILAGGYSSRIGQNKMGLLYQGIPLIHHCIQTMMPFVTDIFVVTGHYHHEISQLLSTMKKVTIIYNECYPHGMFSSVLAGVKHVNADFFILPGDYPLIKPQTYALLSKSKKLIAVPNHQHQRGHPLLIKKELINDLLEEPMDSNLKAFRNRYEIDDIETDDSGILFDIDTLQDHNDLIKKGVEDHGN